jgi:hypothetical protein
MPLRRQAGSNQHRGNPRKLSHNEPLTPADTRSFSVFTGESWRSTYSQATCCVVTAQLQSHMVHWYSQELKSSRKPWYTIDKKKKKGNALVYSAELIIKLRWWTSDTGFLHVCTIDSSKGCVYTSLSPDKHNYKLFSQLVSIFTCPV